VSSVRRVFLSCSRVSKRPGPNRTQWFSGLLRQALNFSSGSQPASHQTSRLGSRSFFEFCGFCARLSKRHGCGGQGAQSWLVLRSDPRSFVACGRLLRCRVFSCISRISLVSQGSRKGRQTRLTSNIMHLQPVVG